MRKNAVFWWEEAPLAALERKPVPPTADVVIVGAGYTGLGAAIRLARAGRWVQVFDKQHPGEGASTRNGGITSGNLRPGQAELVRRFGEDARERDPDRGEGRPRGSLPLHRGGEDRVRLCHLRAFQRRLRARDYERLAREAEMLNRTLGIEAYAVPRSEQRALLGTEFYHGGAVRMDIGGLHPAKFHAGTAAPRPCRGRDGAWRDARRRASGKKATATR